MIDKIYIEKTISHYLDTIDTLGTLKSFVDLLCAEYNSDREIEIVGTPNCDYCDECSEVFLNISIPVLETDEEYNKRITNLQLRKKKYEKELNNLNKNYSDVLAVIDDELFQIEI